MRFRSICILAFSVSLVGFGAAPTHGQSQSATQAQAERVIKSMTRGQAILYARRGRLTNDVAALRSAFRIPFPSGYNLAIRTSSRAAYHYAIADRKPFKSVVGATFIEDGSTPQAPRLVTIVCRLDEPGRIRPADPTYRADNISCGNFSTLIGGPDPYP